MCGKFTQTQSPAEGHTSGDEETVTPMRVAIVIACDREGRRKAVRMRWGFGGAARPHIHARAESIDVKPTFRDAFLHRRGLVVCTSFNEGREITPTKTEQYVLTPQDGRPVAIAVIWEHSAPALLSFAMVTVPPNALIGTITDRMPALLDEKDWAKWLGEEPATPDELKALLRTSERDLDMRPAGKAPRKPRPDQPELF